MKEPIKILPVFHNIDSHIAEKLLNIPPVHTMAGINIDSDELSVQMEEEILKALLNF